MSNENVLATKKQEILVKLKSSIEHHLNIEINRLTEIDYYQILYLLSKVIESDVHHFNPAYITNIEDLDPRTNLEHFMNLSPNTLLSKIMRIIIALSYTPQNFPFNEIQYEVPQDRTAPTRIFTKASEKLDWIHTDITEPELTSGAISVGENLDIIGGLFISNKQKLTVVDFFIPIPIGMYNVTTDDFSNYEYDFRSSLQNLTKIFEAKLESIYKGIRREWHNSTNGQNGGREYHILIPNDLFRSGNHPAGLNKFLAKFGNRLNGNLIELPFNSNQIHRLCVEANNLVIEFQETKTQEKLLGNRFTWL